MTKKSIRGVYNNLEDSTYIVSNGDMQLFFSSFSRLGKFMTGYMKNRIMAGKKMRAFIGDTDLPYEYASDIEYYHNCENKGSLILINGKQATLKEVESYLLHLVADKKELVYSVVSNPHEVNEIREKFVSKFTPNDSVLSKGFTARDATPPTTNVKRKDNED
jgi:hypothetical protein